MEVTVILPQELSQTGWIDRPSNHWILTHFDINHCEDLKYLWYNKEWSIVNTDLAIQRTIALTLSVPNISHKHYSCVLPFCFTSLAFLFSIKDSIAKGHSSTRAMVYVWRIGKLFYFPIMKVRIVSEKSDRKSNAL